MVAHADRTHKKFSASNTYRWSRCYGQPNLLATVPIPRRPSAESAEGTLAHELLEHCLINGISSTGHIPGAKNLADSVRVALEHLDTLRDEFPDITMSIEEELTFPQNRVPREDCGGIADIVAHSMAAKRGWIIDFKHGVVPVDPGADQLWFLATAAFSHFAYIDQITLVIVQPNGFIGETIKTIDIHAYQLLDYQDHIDKVLIHAGQSDAPLIPGEHCTRCDAEAVCLAREEWALYEATGGKARRIEQISGFITEHGGSEFANDKRDYARFIDMSPSRLAQIISIAPFMRAWLKAAKLYATWAALEGTMIPGNKLVETRGRRQYVGDTEEVAREILDIANYAITIDEVAPRKLLNLTDMEPILTAIASAQAPRGKKRQAIEQVKRAFAFLTPSISSGNYTLVPESDTRPAAKPSATVFADVHIAPVTDFDSNDC